MINIIGAGPVGNYLAYLLAKKKQEVKVFEEHETIGKPVQCAGLLTENINKILEIPNTIIVNKIRRVEIILRGQKISLDLKNPNLVLDRVLFDNYLKEKAERAGAKFYLNYKFKDYKKGRIFFFKRKVGIRTDHLIGADGPLSRVAKVTGLYKKRKFVTAIQARINYRSDSDMIRFYIGYGQFAYVIPESDSIAKAAVVGTGNINQEFRNFMRKEIKNYKLREYQSGIIPIYNPRQKIRKKGVYLIGDAATQVKATTYGGLIPGLFSAKLLSESFKNYESNFKRTIGRELKLALLARNVMNSFSAKNYEEFMKLFNKPKIKSIIETYDRDFLTKFILKLVINEPRLIKLGAKGYFTYIFNQNKLEK